MSKYKKLARWGEINAPIVGTTKFQQWSKKEVIFGILQQLYSNSIRLVGDYQGYTYFESVHDYPIENGFVYTRTDIDSIIAFVPLKLSYYNYPDKQCYELLCDTVQPLSGVQEYKYKEKWYQNIHCNFDKVNGKYMVETPDGKLWDSDYFPNLMLYVISRITKGTLIFTYR